jgi:hypothetical protein
MRGLNGNAPALAFGRSDNGPMHLLLPFARVAAVAAATGFEAALSTPTLDRHLAAWRPVARDEADEWHPLPPHERVLAQAMGWSGHPPWAAHQAQADGIDVGDRAWGLITPVHWRVGVEAIHLADPAELQLDADESRAWLDVLRPWFEDEGFTVAWGAPLRWYVAHDSLATVRAASLDRVIGRNVDPWLPAQPEARLIRRLQNEAQMLLYTHPLNAEREARGLPVLNSFWLSGCGVAQPARAHDIVVDERLRAPALAQDEAAWLAAWAALDTALPGMGLARLTLAGERHAVTLAPQPRAWWQRWTADKTRLADVLRTL